MSCRIRLSLVVIIACVGAVAARAMANESLSIEALCDAYPERVQGLFAALDLDRPALAPVQGAVEREAWPEACRALLDYYRKSDTAEWLRAPVPEPGDGTEEAAEAMLDDTFTFYTLEGTVPRRPDGGLDWSYEGPNDDREWAFALNRHSYLSHLLSVYQNTGNAEYARLIDAHIRDWVKANPYRAKKYDSAGWRGLEVHARVKNWARCFYALQQSDALSAEARLLLLSSIPEHAHYLRNFHAGRGNWISMELSALAKAAACWPEFEQSDAWIDYAIERLTPEAEKQVYPDGVQKELTSHYHRVTLGNFEAFAETVRRGGGELPPAFADTITRMWNYLACAMRPDGYGPLNNDSDRDNNRGRVAAEAERRDREDWLYIATNGTRGTRPDGPASAVFPWAGQVIMRSGYAADDHWAFFDIGPYGTGHQHRDKLHLSVMVHGRDVLVDSGRYTYRGGPFRQYFKGSAAHNTVLVDGAGQKPFAETAEAAVGDQVTLTDEYDLAWGRFEAGFEGVDGDIAHTRVVLQVPGRYWVVLDRIETDQPRHIQAPWHFHPHCTVAIDGTTAVSTDAGEGNIRVVPGDGVDWAVDLVSGRGEPSVQGWWSREYNHKEPSPVAVFDGKIPGPTTFAWLLLPGRGMPAQGSVAILETADDAYTVMVAAGEQRQRIVMQLDAQPEADITPAP